MRRRDESAPGSGGGPTARFNNYALFIDRDRVRSHIGQRKLRMGQSVARVLHPYLVTRAHQHPDCNLDGVLGAGGNDDLLGFATNCACSLQILGKGLAQFHQTAGVCVTKVLRPKRTGREVGQLPPHLGCTAVNQSSASVKRQALEWAWARSKSTMGSVGQKFSRAAPPCRLGNLISSARSLETKVPDPARATR
jgi:hypothetical protein